MKNNVRFIGAALILAFVAALGFSRGAWAGSLFAGTVPDCPASNASNNYNNCTASVTGTGTITSVNMPTDPNGNSITVPGALNNGPAELLTGVGSGGVELCFPDVDTPPVGDIFIWNAATSTWVFVPTFHQLNPSMSCTLTFTNGLYTIEY